MKVKQVAALPKRLEIMDIEMNELSRLGRLLSLVLMIFRSSVVAPSARFWSICKVIRSKMSSLTEKPKPQPPG